MNVFGFAAPAAFTPLFPSACGAPVVAPNSIAWYAGVAARQLLPAAVQGGGCIPMSSMAQMAYGPENFSNPNRASAQFFLGQPGLLSGMQAYQNGFGGRWGGFGGPCLTSRAFSWIQNGGSCWNGMSRFCTAPMQAYPVAGGYSRLDFNSCARTINRAFNSGNRQSFNVQDLINMSNGQDPVAREAASTMLGNPQWMAQLTGGDGNMSRDDLNRASISPQNSADARAVAEHMRSTGMRVMPSDQIMRGQSANMALAPELRAAYGRLMEGGEYSAYRAIEQIDVRTQPDGCSDISNFLKAASYNGM